MREHVREQVRKYCMAHIHIRSDVQGRQQINMGALHKCRRSFVFFFRHRHEFACLNYSTMTGNTKVDQAMDKLTGGKLDGWLMTYEEMVGLTEVRAAQEKVIQV